MKGPKTFFLNSPSPFRVAAAQGKINLPSKAELAGQGRLAGISEGAW